MWTITGDEKIKLLAINDLLAKQEIKIVERYQLLEKEVEELILQEKIHDYNLELTLQCFTSDKELNEKYKSEEGSPLFQTFMNFESLQDKKTLWNEYYLFRNSILESFLFCYTCYCILSHSPMLLNEILKIENVWINITVDFQWNIELIKSK